MPTRRQSSPLTRPVGSEPSSTGYEIEAFGTRTRHDDAVRVLRGCSSRPQTYPERQPAIRRLLSARTHRQRMRIGNRDAWPTTKIRPDMLVMPVTGHREYDVIRTNPIEVGRSGTWCSNQDRPRQA